MPNFTADPRLNSPKVLHDSLQDPAKGSPRNGTCKVQHPQVAPEIPNLGARFLVCSSEPRSELTLYLPTLVAPRTYHGPRQLLPKTPYRFLETWAPISSWFEEPLVSVWHLRATCMTEFLTDSWEHKPLSLPMAFQLPRPQLVPMALSSSCSPRFSAGSQRSLSLGYPSVFQLQWPQGIPLAQGSFNSSRISEVPYVQAPNTQTVPSSSGTTAGSRNFKHLP